MCVPLSDLAQPLDGRPVMIHVASKSLFYRERNQLGKDDALWELVSALEVHRGTGDEVWQTIEVVPPVEGNREVMATLTSPDGSLGRVRVRITVEVIDE
jgi:hypothetical protein